MLSRTVFGIAANALNILAIAVLGLRGKKRRAAGWAVYLGGQCCWMLFALAGRVYELLPLSLCASAVAVRNLVSLGRRMHNGNGCHDITNP